MSADRPSYTVSARVLHWVTAALVLSMIPFGLIMVRIKEGPTQDLLFNLHRSIGVILLPLVVIRLINRINSPPLPLPPDISKLQRCAAHATHWLLYLLLIVQPIIGWIATSAYGATIGVFWLFDLPAIWPKNEALAEGLFKLHENLGFAMAALICAHIGAALFHHFIHRDRVLMRMITG